MAPGAHAIGARLAEAIAHLARRDGAVRLLARCPGTERPLRDLEGLDASGRTG